MNQKRKISSVDSKNNFRTHRLHTIQTKKDIIKPSENGDLLLQSDVGTV